MPKQLTKHQYGNRFPHSWFCLVPVLRSPPADGVEKLHSYGRGLERKERALPVIWNILESLREFRRAASMNIVGSKIWPLYAFLMTVYFIRKTYFWVKLEHCETNIVVFRLCLCCVTSACWRSLQLWKKFCGFLSRGRRKQSQKRARIKSGHNHISDVLNFLLIPLEFPALDHIHSLLHLSDPTFIPYPPNFVSLFTI